VNSGPDLTMLRLLSLFRRPPAVVDSAPWPAPGQPATDITATRQRRIDRLAARLAEDGLVWVDPLPSGEAALDALDLLDDWTWSTWRGRLRFDDMQWPAFRTSPWPDGAVGGLFTEIADVGFAIADVACTLRPDLVWSVDDYVGHAVDGVETAGELVLLDPSVPLDATDPQVIDCFGTAMLRAMQAALRDEAPEPLREGLRPLLWFTHRHLFD
jgi:hypothetical protein